MKCSIQTIGVSTKKKDYIFKEKKNKYPKSVYDEAIMRWIMCFCSKWNGIKQNFNICLGMSIPYSFYECPKFIGRNARSCNYVWDADQGNPLHVNWAKYPANRKTTQEAVCVLMTRTFEQSLWAAKKGHKDALKKNSNLWFQHFTDVTVAV